MSQNDASSFAQRLYFRIPADYRARDAERDFPLLALLRVIAEQAANLRQDLDSLWDNFFIETCDDWVVPYLGALLGTNLLAHPVGQSDRMDVWNTVIWRRSKGTPQMLRALAVAISEWPCDIAEFFQHLGWSQNLNHLRLDSQLTPDLRDRYRLSLLGRASDPFSHAADFKPANALDQPRISGSSLGIGRSARSTPGRYQIKNLGFFLRRLQTFPVRGATPAAVSPGATVPASAFCFTFDPLHRDMPLFTEKSQAPLTRAAFDNAPWQSFGTDIAVRQFGILLANNVESVPALSTSHLPFTFGGAAAGLSLQDADGLRLLQPDSFQLGASHFVISAEWHQDNDTVINLGRLSTLYASVHADGAFELGSTATKSGRLVITVQPGDASLGSWGPPSLPSSPAALFPGAVVAVRAQGVGPLHNADGLYIYLGSAFLTPSDPAVFHVADDGSTFSTPDLAGTALARASEGQLYPARSGAPSLQPALAFTALNRGANGMRLPDPSRFATSGVLYQADLFTGAFQPLGGIASIDQPAASYPKFHVPDPWPAFTYGPNPHAVAGNDLPALLTILVKPLSQPSASPRRRRSPQHAPAAPFLPPAELIVMNRRGESLLVYLPEVADPPSAGVRFLVAGDGSTFFFPTDSAAQQSLLLQDSLAGLDLARTSSGQVLPIPGRWPLQQRQAVSINLCRCERSTLLGDGELGIDPELGRFAFADHDPAIGQGNLTVDYVEAFSDRVGALNFDRQIDPTRLATRLVSHTGDAAASASAVPNAPVHKSLSFALAAAQDGDIIEIVDSATYAESAPIVLSNLSLRSLTVRAAAQQRPCFTFYTGPDAPASASLVVSSPMSQLELSGLLVSGGPLVLDAAPSQLLLTACTLDPRSAALASIVFSAGDSTTGATALLCRCITGGLLLGPAISQFTAADSILDQQGGYAIAAATALTSPPFDFEPALATIQLERVTVFGQVLCDVLNASECLLDDLAHIDDQQSGCIRFTRFETGSVLPRRYRCIPTDEQVAAWPAFDRVMPPLFNSRQFGRPDYAQLALAGLALGVARKFQDMTAQEKMRFSQAEILTASEAGAEVGAFAGTLNAIRLTNLGLKLQEFMPVGLSAVLIAET